MDLAEVIKEHQANNFTAAETGYKNLLRENPNSHEINHLLAILYGQQGSLTNAEIHIKQAIKLNEKVPSYYNSYANIKKYQEDLDGAINLYQKSLKINSNNPAAYYNLGIVYLKQQQFEKAVDNLEIAIAKKPDYDDAYIVLIQHLFEIGENERAIKMLSESSKYDFQDPTFIKLQAFKLRHENNLEESIKTLENYIKIKSDDYSAYHHLAAAQLMDSNIESATKNYLIALDLKEDHHESHHNIAVIYLTQNKLDLALKHWLRALNFETNIDYLYNTGVVYNYKGQYSNALTYFEKCLEIAPLHYNSIANIAVIYLKKNMPVEAKFYFKKALSIKPNDEQTLYMLAALDGKNDEFSEAPQTYVADLFDQYANSFEQHLTKILHYSAPKVIYDILVKYNDIENSKDLVICDIGCGTGFMGEKLTSHCSKLDGVDLSEKMLDKANEKNIYTRLIKSDICQHLNKQPSEYDYISAADVVPYYGDIGPLLKSVSHALKGGAHFIFTVEESEEDNYKLQTNGRFQHNINYVINLAEQAGFKIICKEQHSTRKEGKHPIPCIIFLIKKITK